MDRESFNQDKEEVVNELIPENSQYYWSKDKREKATALADEILLNKPVEGIYLFMRAFNVGYYMSSLAHPSDWINVFKKKFAKHIHVKHNTFDTDFITHLDNFKSSPWDINITVNGKMVERLK